MSRYLGPRFKIIRRLGYLFGLTTKDKNQRAINSKKKNTKLRSKIKSQYSIRLEEKKKLRFYYGLTERQLRKYVRLAIKAKGSTGEVLLQLIEMRLDNIIFRLGMSSTIPQARQLVNHRHISVNDHIVNIPSYRCKPKDIILVKDKSKAILKNYMMDSAICNKDLPKHLTIDTLQYKGFVNNIINREEVGLNKINELLVVESYDNKI